MRYAIILLLLFAGCGQTPLAVDEFVPIAEVEPSLVDVARKNLPNVKFENARKIKVDGEDAFEIRGKMPNGKIREVEVSAAGKVIKIR